MTVYQVALGLHLLLAYGFGVAVGWALWGAPLGLAGPLPGYGRRPVAPAAPARHSATDAAARTQALPAVRGHR